MPSPSREPIYGPIESAIDRARRILKEKRPDNTYGVSQQNRDLAYFGAIYPMHLGVNSPLKILPALGVVRGFAERYESGEKAETTEDLSKALKPHFTLHHSYWNTQRDYLVKLYLLDREFIDRALDFEAAKQQERSLATNPSAK